MSNLRLTDLAPEPIQQFRRWYDDAVKAGFRHPDAMTLATASAKGRPSARIVLYKGVDAGGAFRVYTNFESRKGRELDSNPFAALVFYWEPLDRQIRVEGRAEKLTHAESVEYFRTRPRESQLGAWASHQSQPIAGRWVLERRFEELRREFEGQDIPCPENWGGFRIVPEMVEFWAAGHARLHDRYRYSREGEGSWKIEQLSP